MEANHKTERCKEIFGLLSDYLNLVTALLLAFGEQDQRVPLTHGKRLREALGTAGALVQTVRGAGYRFSAQAEQSDQGG